MTRTIPNRNIQEREGIITTLEPGDVPANLNEVQNEALARNTYRNHKEPGGSSPSGSSSCMLIC